MKNLKDQIESVVDVYKSGDLAKAEDLTQKLIDKNPKVTFLYNLLGLILAQQEKDELALECYEKGIKIDPKYGMIYNNIGLLLFKVKTSSNIKKAEDFYKKAIYLDKNIPEPHNNLGTLYNHLNKVDEAINCYKKAINMNPKFSYAHHNLGSAYISIGEIEKAKLHFKESIKLNPNFPDTHRSLSRVIKYTENDDHLKELKLIYKNIKSNEFSKKVEINFALGKAYEDLKDFDKSFMHYNEANENCRKKINFSLTVEKKMFEDVKNIFTTKLYKKYSDVGYKEKSPIFIVGMPRSGTTLIEQILSAHPKVFGCDEVEYIPKLLNKNFGENNLSLFFDKIVNFDEKIFQDIGKEYISKMREISSNHEITTDKLPVNFLHIGFIKLILPNSKIIHCYRNSKDNCLSLFKNYFSANKIKYAYDLNEIVSYYNLYKDLMDYWLNLFPNFIFNLNYEKIVTSTESEIKKLLNFCSLDWNNNCLNFHKNKRVIKTASDIQARSKIYKSSISSWKNYEKHLSKYFNKLPD